MNIHAKAILIPDDNVDTDVLYPGKYLNVLDPKRHGLIFLKPGSETARSTQGRRYRAVRRGKLWFWLLKEQPATAMAASGVRAVIGKSFARIFAATVSTPGCLRIEMRTPFSR